MQRYCVFCEIVARREPAEILYESEQVIAIRNVLRWVPVMLLVVRVVRASRGWYDAGLR